MVRHWYFGAGIVLAGSLLAPPANGEVPAEPAPLETAGEPSVVTAAKPAVVAEHTDVEVVRERYPDGKVKVEREVIRDAEENYVNHGTWKMWDKSGNVVGEGRYVNGQRQGVWTGWFMPAEVPLLGEMPYKQYQGPFISQAEFDGGKLNGRWVIYDAKQRKISEWNYLAGRRHGSWTSWYANGKKMREVNYVNGDLDGKMMEWTPDGAVSTNETYQGGHKLDRKIEYHTANQKKSEGMYLFAKQELAQEDEWWDAKLAKFTSVGKDVRHGDATMWHPNGQVQMQGAYEYDQPVGTFTWWYANGQKAVQGTYTSGQRQGEWAWYHQNGQKSTHGEFAVGAPHGRWIWWNPQGKVSQKIEYSPGAKGDAAAVVADKGSTRVGDKVEPADEPAQGDKSAPAEESDKLEPQPAEDNSGAAAEEKGEEETLVPQAAAAPEPTPAEEE
jgi:antitoxin component YwqK of YwqJK toxin-antitoxin module